MVFQVSIRKLQLNLSHCNYQIKYVRASKLIQISGAKKKEIYFPKQIFWISKKWACFQMSERLMSLQSMNKVEMTNASKSHNLYKIRIKNGSC